MITETYRNIWSLLHKFTAGPKLDLYEAQNCIFDYSTPTLKFLFNKVNLSSLSVANNSLPFSVSTFAFFKDRRASDTKKNKFGCWRSLINLCILLQNLKLLEELSPVRKATANKAWTHLNLSIAVSLSSNVVIVFLSTDTFLLQISRVSLTWKEIDLFEDS